VSRRAFLCRPQGACANHETPIETVTSARPSTPSIVAEPCRGLGGTDQNRIQVTNLVRLLQTFYETRENTSLRLVFGWLFLNRFMAGIGEL